MAQSELSTDQLLLDAEAQDLIFREARTANTFSPEPVSEEQVRAIYDLVRYGPTSLNIMPVRVFLIRSAEARERLLPLMSDGNRPKTASAPLTGIFAVDMEFHENLPQLVPYRPDAKDAFADLDVRERVGRFNATLQIAYWLIGIRAAGLAAGPMAGFDAAGVDREFFPDGRHHSLLVVNIGRPGPDAWFDRLPRLEFDQTVRTL